MAPLRSLKADLIGGLITCRGIVTRVSEVRPIVSVACYICEVCGFEVYQTVQSKIFMPLVDCPSNICKQNRSRGKLIPNNRYSLFEIPKIIESPNSLLIKKSESKKLLKKSQSATSPDLSASSAKARTPENALPETSSSSRAASSLPNSKLKEASTPN